MNMKYIILSVVMVAALICDLKLYKIPNKLILAGMASGVIVRMIDSGIIGIAQWAGGFAALLVLTYMMYRLHVVGAGDSKLFAVIGGFLGVYAGVGIVLLSLLAAALPAMILLIKGKHRMHYALPMTIAFFIVWLLEISGIREGLKLFL